MWKWRVMSEISDIVKDNPEQEEIDLAEIDRAKMERVKIFRYNTMILKYLDRNKKRVDEITKQDVENLTEDMSTADKHLFIKQVVKAIETNYWKPIQRVKENNKCALFN